MKNTRGTVLENTNKSLILLVVVLVVDVGWFSLYV